MKDQLEERYESYLLRAKIMNVAAQLANDSHYEREDAVQELVNIVNWVEGKELEAPTK